MKMFFEENIELIIAFYKSDFYNKKLLGNTRAIKRIIEAIYRDSDMMDEK